MLTHIPGVQQEAIWHKVYRCRNTAGWDVWINHLPTCSWPWGALGYTLLIILQPNIISRLRQGQSKLHTMDWMVKNRWKQVVQGVQQVQMYFRVGCTRKPHVYLTLMYGRLHQLVDYDPVYSAKKAGLGRGSARPFCHCKRTQRPNARPKTAAAETISRGSLGRGSARPFLTVNASRPKCGTKCDPRIRKYVRSSWHHRIWRHYPAFFFDRCSYFVFFFCGDYQICPCKLLTKT